jgi:hypothetical protein
LSCAFDYDHTFYHVHADNRWDSPFNIFEICRLGSSDFLSCQQCFM